ncbi:hypothetical protein [Parathermosynechococcus lividus]
MTNPHASPDADPPPIEGLDVKVVFIYYFAWVTAITAFTTSQVFHWSLLSPFPYRWGLAVGSIAGVVAAYWNHTTMLALPLANPRQLPRQLQVWLTEHGYTLADANENMQIYRPRFWHTWLHGTIVVESLSNRLRLYSRSGTIKQLRQDLAKVLEEDQQ